MGMHPLPSLPSLTPSPHSHLSFSLSCRRRRLRRLRLPFASSPSSFPSARVATATASRASRRRHRRPRRWRPVSVDGADGGGIGVELAAATSWRSGAAFIVDEVGVSTAKTTETATGFRSPQPKGEMTEGVGADGGLDLEADVVFVILVLDPSARQRRGPARRYIPWWWRRWVPPNPGEVKVSVLRRLLHLPPLLAVPVAGVAAPVAAAGAAQPANHWSRLLAAMARSLFAAADGRSHAFMLVNSHLSCRYMQGMDLGVLKDMPGIREKASGNLAHREEQCQSMLVSAYREMVRLCLVETHFLSNPRLDETQILAGSCDNYCFTCQRVLATAELVKASHSMRCFSKVAMNSPLIWFTERQDDLNGSGDGGGSPVFKWFSVIEFKNLAQELADMFISELQLKRLLVLELLSVTFKEGVQHDASLEWSDELFNVEFNEFQSNGLVLGDSYALAKNWIVDVSRSWQPGQTPSHEVLQEIIMSFQWSSRKHN